MRESDIDSLLWSLLILAIGGAVMFMWNTDIPAPLLWAGYLAVIVGAGMLIRWWIGVVR